MNDRNQCFDQYFKANSSRLSRPRKDFESWADPGMQKHFRIIFGLHLNSADVSQAINFCTLALSLFWVMVYQKISMVFLVRYLDHAKLHCWLLATVLTIIHACWSRKLLPFLSTRFNLLLKLRQNSILISDIFLQ